MADHPSSLSSSSTSDPPPTQTLIPNLPNDVALHCISHIPRFYYPTLILVSKPWHSTLRSPLLHATRRTLNLTESFLFLNLRIFNPKDSSFSFNWYSLDPSRTISPQINQNPRFLSPIKPPPSHPIGASFVSLGCKVYVIGGSVNDIASNNMWVFDCLANEWNLGPRMRVGREFAASGVINGKIYVVGGCVVDTWARAMCWAEVFDPESGLWEAVPSPVEVKDKWMHASGVVGGRMYAMADRGGVSFKPGAGVGEWGVVSTELDMGWRGRAVVLDEVLYCYDYLGKIRGFDFEGNVWRELRGVKKSLPKFLCGATMANVGGRLFVLWEGKGNGSGNKGKAGGGANGKEMEVLCAEISVKKDEAGELWGSVVWSDVIIVIPKGSSVVHCLEVQL